LGRLNVITLSIPPVMPPKFSKVQPNSALDLPKGYERHATSETKWSARAHAHICAFAEWGCEVFTYFIDGSYNQKRTM
jgi:hypothetical protein